MSGTEGNGVREGQEQPKERASGSAGEGRQEAKECSDGSDPMNDSAPSHNNTKVFGTPIRTDSKLASPFSPLHFKRGDTARNSSIFMAESPFPSFFQKRGFLSRAGDGTYSNSNTPLQMKNYHYNNDEDRSQNGDDASFNPVLNSPFLRRPGEEPYYEGHEKMNSVLFSPAIHEMRDSAILKASSPHRDDQHSYPEIFHNQHRLSDFHRLEPRLQSDPPHSPMREHSQHLYGYSPKYPRPNSFRKLDFNADSKTRSPYPVPGCITPQFIVDEFRPPIGYMEEYHYRCAPPVFHPEAYHPEVEDIGRNNLIRIKHPEADKFEDETFSRIMPRHATTSKKAQKRKMPSQTNSDSKMKHHHPYHVNLRHYATLQEIPPNSEMYPPHPQFYYNTRSVSFGGFEEGQEGYTPHDRENRAGYAAYEAQGYEEGGVISERAAAYRERVENKRNQHSRYDPNDQERRQILIMSTTIRKSPNRSSMSGSKKHVKQVEDPKEEEEVPQPHKPCSCSKSKCLKLYCECFAAGHHCGKDCNCTVCMNKPEFEDKRQEAIKNTQDRNSHAFKPKIGVSKDTGAQHLKGCTCKKSHCIKNYCECYQNGVACGEQCKCICCKNSIEDRMMRSQTVLSSSEKMRRTHDSARKPVSDRKAMAEKASATFGNASENSSPLNLPTKHLSSNVSHFGGQKGECGTSKDLTPSPFKNPEKLWSSEKCPENEEETEDFVVKVKKLPSELKLVGSKRTGTDILKSVGDDNKEPSLTKKKKSAKAAKLRQPLLTKESQFLAQKVKEAVVSSIKSTEAKKNKRLSRKEEQSQPRKKSERIHKQRAE